VDDGIPLTDQVTIQSICHGQTHAEGYTDSKGNFSLDLGGRTQEAMPSAEDTGSGLGSRPGSTQRQGTRRQLQDCDLQAVLPGFTSQVVPLASKISDFGNADIGTIVLHRMEHVEGLTISATSAQAPDKARKDFEKGREEEKKAKWEAAKQRFSEAVELYPKYAVAWYELGKVQLEMKDVAAAKKSFEQALTADAKYISPLQDLAALAVQAKDWKAAADNTEKILSLNPLSFPQIWYYNAAANYYLNAFDKAEKSARQGLIVDVQHRFPRLEYVLGIILVQKHDYQGAVAHIRSYLQLAPHAADAQHVQQQMAEVEKLSAGLEQSANK